MQRILSQKLISCIQNHADSIVRQWIDRLKSDPTTADFAESDLGRFELRAHELMEHLGQWASYETNKTDVGQRYAQEGMGLFRMGIPLCEGIRAIILLKRTLWLCVLYENQLDTAIELNQLRELNDRLTLFFDRSEYYFIRGYMEEMNRKMKELWNLSDKETDRVFFGGSFYKRNRAAAKAAPARATPGLRRSSLPRM